MIQAMSIVIGSIRVHCGKLLYYKLSDLNWLLIAFS